MSSSIPILFSDNHLLIVNKPAGLVTQGASSDEPSVHRLMCEYIKERYQKPGNVYLGIVSRLDAVTSGIVVLARTSKAASRLSEQFRSRRVEKHYLAVLEGELEVPLDQWVDWGDRIEKNETLEKMVSIPFESSRGQEARLKLRCLGRFRGRSLVLVQLETGRKHQIRVQAASRGHPVVGDKKYGGMPWNRGMIALHAFSLQIEHPTLRTPISLSVPVPEVWNELAVSVPPLKEMEGYCG